MAIIESFWSSIHAYVGGDISTESKTVPDMSLSVRDILLNFRRGYDMGDLMRNVIDTEDDIDDDSLDGIHDLVDLKERKDYLNEKVYSNLRDYYSGDDGSKPGFSRSEERPDPEPSTNSEP